MKMQLTFEWVWMRMSMLDAGRLRVESQMLMMVGVE
jgi:hypothetical protein